MLTLSRVDQRVIIAASMIVDSVPTRSIDFFVSVYPEFLSDSILSCSDMANSYGCTPQAAVKHVKNLERRGYLRRVHYRAWSLSDSIKDYIERLGTNG